MNSQSANVDKKWIRDVPVERRPVTRDTPFFRLTSAFDFENVLAATRYKPEKEDLFIATYPKNGTTWMQQMVYLIQHDGVPPETFEHLRANSVFFEARGLAGVKAIEQPGSIKIHLAADIAPFSDVAKYIVVVRNPKDTLVSYYNHHKGFDKYYHFEGDFDDFFDSFIGGQVEFGDYFHFLNSWLERRHLPNVLFITYEDMKNSPIDCIRRVAHFVDQKYGERADNDAKYLNNILHHSSFSQMEERYRKYSHVGSTSGYYQVYKGIMNSWKTHFTEEQSRLLSQRFIEEAEDNPLLMTVWSDYSWLHDHQVTKR